MARAIWSGAISFGLLNVPVKLYSAVSEKTVRFRELREDDGARIRHKRVAEADGEEVPYEKIVKGFEIAPEHYVVLTKDELAELDPKKTRAIEIQDFVDLEGIDPIYFERPYYLAPAPGAAKAYSLLVRAMREARKVAIARFVLRNREHLAAIRPLDDVLTLTTMRFADEVVQPGEIGELEVDGSKPAKRELEMAKQLVDSLGAKFDPEAYRDEYREQLLDLIERKAEGKTIVSQPQADLEPTAAPDLMAALEQSLAAVKSEELGAGAKRKPAAKAKPQPKAKPAAKKPTKAKPRARSKAGR